MAAVGPDMLPASVSAAWGYVSTGSGRRRVLCLRMGDGTMAAISSDTSTFQGAEAVNLLVRASTDPLPEATRWERHAMLFVTEPADPNLRAERLNLLFPNS